MVTRFLSDLTEPQVPDYSEGEAMCGHSCYPSHLLPPLVRPNPRQKRFSWIRTNIFIFRQCLRVAQLASNSVSFCLHLPQIQCHGYMHVLPHSTCFTDFFYWQMLHWLCINWLYSLQENLLLYMWSYSALIWEATLWYGCPAWNILLVYFS